MLKSHVTSLVTVANLFRIHGLTKIDLGAKDWTLWPFMSGVGVARWVQDFIIGNHHIQDSHASHSSLHGPLLVNVYQVAITIINEPINITVI